ncbi:hypothetical protein [Adhaeribacter soli]|uniref:Uncharacterized protein n=1 Tax=Adhaeribacter soli TaxID=2607655 RepID=A0A5N1J0I5_9BACT|nr:hypothetical protein [Adhaeribacter soli]KAA9340140.1 hypothetical protein F0P94_07265 [Adhaeribacter soli]
MKKLKDITVPVAGRISPELKHKFELAAAELGVSMAQYVSLMLYLAEDDETNLESIKSQLLETIKSGDQQITRTDQQKEVVWEKAPFAGMLEAVLKNEKILAELFVTNGNRPVPSTELVDRGFKYNVLLQGEYHDKVYYYFTGLHGWAFTDSSKKYVSIIKKV